MKTFVRVDGKTYETEIQDLDARPIRVLVDGETFEIFPEDTAASAPLEFSLPPREFAPGASANGGSSSVGNVVRAPMPGVILTVAVKQGDAVHTGQELCVLEAMKMKNVIRATRDGSVKSVTVTAGQHVKHRDMLCELA